MSIAYFIQSSETRCLFVVVDGNLVSLVQPRSDLEATKPELFPAGFITPLVTIAFRFCNL